jgi:hypothetical protein
MASNTQIFIKRSEANNTPGPLHAGELAYSYASNTLFIGANTATGPGYYKIGGEYYTNIIDSATSSNTPDTLVIRDGNGDFAAGNVTAAYFIGDGSALTGLVTNLTINGDTGGPNTLHLLTDTLTFNGASGITTTISGNEVIFDVDNTVVRSNTEGAAQLILTDVQISGNLVVQGNTTYVNTAIYQTTDSLIQLASNNTTGDVVDIGFYGKHEGVDGTVVTGLVRNAGTSDYYLFDNITLGDQENLTSNLITSGAMSANGAALYAKQFFAADMGQTGGYAFNTNAYTGLFSDVNDSDIYLSLGGDKVLNANVALNNYSLGQFAGLTNQGINSIAIGYSAGNNTQGQKAVAIGSEAGQNTQSSFAVAVGLHAGQETQGTAAVAIGHSAGQFNQGQDSLAIGAHAGQNTQGFGATSVGYRAGYGNNTSQGDYAVALGYKAGYDSQIEYSIAINASGNSLNPTEAGLYIDPIRANNAVGGNVTTYNTTTKELVSTDIVINNSGITLANGTIISDGESGLFIDALNYGETPNIAFYNVATHEITFGAFSDLVPSQNLIANGTHTWTVSADTGALYSDQGTELACSANSVVLGQTVDVTNSNSGRVAIGWYAGSSSQNQDAIAIGNSAGQTNQSISAVAIGNGAGVTGQSFSGVAVGRWAGEQYQGWDSVAVGRRAGRVNQGSYSVAMGWGAGVDYQGSHAVAIGDSAGGGNQSQYAVAIGDQAGNTSQGWAGTSLGHHAGRYNQGSVAVAIGASAARTSQGQASVAIGRFAGDYQQGTKSVAIGRYAGSYQQGRNSIAIGENAGNYQQADYSIVLNASGDSLNGLTSGFFVNPIAYTEAQDATYDGLMFYNTNSKEVRYSYALDGGVF